MNQKTTEQRIARLRLRTRIKSRKPGFAHLSWLEYQIVCAGRVYFRSEHQAVAIKWAADNGFILENAPSERKRYFKG